MASAHAVLFSRALVALLRSFLELVHRYGSGFASAIRSRSARVRPGPLYMYHLELGNV